MYSCTFKKLVSDKNTSGTQIVLFPSGKELYNLSIPENYSIVKNISLFDNFIIQRYSQCLKIYEIIKKSIDNVRECKDIGICGVEIYRIIKEKKEPLPVPEYIDIKYKKKDSRDIYYVDLNIYLKNEYHYIKGPKITIYCEYDAMEHNTFKAVKIVTSIDQSCDLDFLIRLIKPRSDILQHVDNYIEVDGESDLFYDLLSNGRGLEVYRYSKSDKCIKLIGSIKNNILSSVNNELLYLQQMNNELIHIQQSINKLIHLQQKTNEPIDYIQQMNDELIRLKEKTDELIRLKENTDELLRLQQRTNELEQCIKQMDDEIKNSELHVNMIYYYGLDNIEHIRTLSSFLNYTINMLRDKRNKIIKLKNKPGLGDVLKGEIKELKEKWKLLVSKIGGLKELSNMHPILSVLVFMKICKSKIYLSKSNLLEVLEIST